MLRSKRVSMEVLQRYAAARPLVCANQTLSCEVTCLCYTLHGRFLLVWAASTTPPADGSDGAWLCRGSQRQPITTSSSCSASRSSARGGRNPLRRSVLCAWPLRPARRLPRHRQATSRRHDQQDMGYVQRVVCMLCCLILLRVGGMIGMSADLCRLA